MNFPVQKLELELSRWQTRISLALVNEKAIQEIVISEGKRYIYRKINGLKEEIGGEFGV